MDLALLVARLILAVVFAVAGVAKLADLPGSRRAAQAFGVPANLVGFVGAGLPVAELAVAALLLPTGTALWGAIGALALLLVFLAAMANQLRRGQHPECHCFGQIHSEQVGASTIVRNGVLAAVAAFIAVAGWNGGGASLVGWADSASAAMVVALAVSLATLVILGAVVWLVVHVLGQQARLLDRLDTIDEAIADIGIGTDAPGGALMAGAPLELGEKAPKFALPNLDGGKTTLNSLIALGPPVLLVFTEPTCAACTTLLPSIGYWQREFADKLTVALVSRGSVEANRLKMGEHGLTNVLLQEDREVARAYGADVTPAAVMVGQNRAIRSGLALGPDVIRQLVGMLIGREAANAAAPQQPAAVPAPAPAAAPPAAPAAPAVEDESIGKLAPNLEMRDLNGQPVRMASFRLRPTLLLFWNLDSRLCVDMLDDLKAIDAKPARNAPRLVVVSSGPVAATKAMRLRSRIINDPQDKVSQAFGAKGTPAAVLLDAEGKISSAVTYGARNILARANGIDPADAPANGTERIGRPAPNLPMRAIDGRTVTLADYHGRPTLVVLWDTNCGFCRRMLPALQAHDANPPAGAPALLVASTGSDGQLAEMNLSSTVVDDNGDYLIRRAFRSYRTPSAVLVDAEGRIASPIAQGEAEVMPLARATTPEERAVAIAAVGSLANAAPQSPAPSRTGERAPAFTLPNLDGEPVAAASLQGDRGLLLFWNPDCGFCQRMLPALQDWERDQPVGAPRLLVVSQGSPERNRELGLRSPILLDQGFSLSSAFGATGTPSAVMLDAEGRIASEVAVGAKAVFDLANSPVPVRLFSGVPVVGGEPAVEDDDEDDDDEDVGLPIGTMAPAMTLPDQAGNPVNLADLRGQRTLVLFWDPECSFCEGMIGDLRAWDASPPADAPRLVVVSAGGVDANRALGLRSPVLSDPEEAVSDAFDVSSTPAAVLLDEDGRIASRPAGAAPNVFALAAGLDPFAATAPLPVGAPAPSLALRDISGNPIDLAPRNDRQTLVIFWDPDESDCRRQRLDLLALENGLDVDGPAMVVVSRGNAERTGRQGFRSPIASDPAGAAMRAYGVTEPPAAVLIDGAGRVASAVATGAAAIARLATAGSRPSVPAASAQPKRRRPSRRTAART